MADENPNRTSKFFDGLTFNHTPNVKAGSKKRDIAKEIMDKYHNENKQKNNKPKKAYRVKPANVKSAPKEQVKNNQQEQDKNPKKKGSKFLPVVGAILLLGATVLSAWAMRQNSIKANLKTPVISKISDDDLINKITSNDDEKTKIAEQVATTGTHRDGKETELSSLEVVQKLESEDVLGEDGLMTKTIAEILKSADGDYITHLKKIFSTTAGKVVCEKNIYLDKAGDVITAFQYDYDKKGNATFSSKVDYDENMIAYAKKVAGTAGKDMALDAVNLSLLVSEEALSEEFKDDMGKDFVRVTVNNAPKFQEQAGVSMSAGKEKNLETSVYFDIIINNDKSRDAVLLAGSEVSFDLNGFTQAKFYVSGNPMEHINLFGGVSAKQNGTLEFAVGGMYSTNKTAELNKPVFSNQGIGL